MAAALAGCEDKDRDGDKDSRQGGSGSPTAGKPAPEAAPQPSQFKLQVLHQQKLPPSAGDQTVSWQGQVSVTVPGGLLKEPAELVISKVQDPPAPNSECYASQGVYDISLGGRHRFDKELTIELPYDPSRLSASLPPEAQVWVEYFEPALGYYLPVNCRIDAVRKKVIARTRHLSPFAVLNPQGGGDYKLWLAQELGGQREVLAIIHYNDKAIRSETLSFRDKKIAMELKKLDSDQLPGYVAKVADYAYSAIRAYRAVGLNPYSVPLRLYVESRKATPDSWANEWTGNIHYNTSASSLEALRYAVAHEIFHNVQLQYYWPAEFPMYRGWLESTAEYASCRIAMPSYAYMGKLDMGERRRALPKYLTKDLTYWKLSRPKDADPWRSHEYAGSYFLDYLSIWGGRKIADEPKCYFATIFPRVAKKGGWEALQAFLDDVYPRERMAGLYSEFAVSYLFEPSSPLYFTQREDDGQTITGHNASGAVHERALGQTVSLSDDGKPVDVPFRLDEKLTARIVRLACSADVPRWHALIEPKDPIGEGVTLYACLLKGNDRQKGRTTHRLQPGKVRLMSPRREDGLYVVACTGKDAAAPGVSVTVLPTKEKAFAHEFKTSIPGHGIEVGISVEGTVNGPQDPDTVQVRPAPRWVDIRADKFLEPTVVSAQATYRVVPKYKIHAIYEINKVPTNCQVEITLKNPRLMVYPTRPDMKLLDAGIGQGETVSTAFILPSKAGVFTGSVQVALAFDQDMNVSKPVLNNDGVPVGYEHYKKYTQTLTLDVLRMGSKGR